jgi:hypothetical protein
LLATLVGLLTCGATSADDDTTNKQPGPASLSRTLDATRSVREPLNLLLTQAELQAIVRGYEDRTGEVLTAPIGDDDEIVVTAPGEHAPMRDRSQDVMGGIAAPFWALAHPKDAWRIFVPIPPKGTRIDERPAPDPR